MWTKTGLDWGKKKSPKKVSERAPTSPLTLHLQLPWRPQSHSLLVGMSGGPWACGELHVREETHVTRQGSQKLHFSLPLLGSRGWGRSVSCMPIALLAVWMCSKKAPFRKDAVEELREAAVCQGEMQGELGYIRIRLSHIATITCRKQWSVLKDRKWKWLTWIKYLFPLCFLRSLGSHFHYVWGLHGQQKERMLIVQRSRV